MSMDDNALDCEKLAKWEAEAAKVHNPFDLSDACAFEDFHANPRQHLDQLGESGRPRVLKVEDGRDVVVQSAEAYRNLLRRLDYAECVIGIREGLDAVERGDTLPLDEAFEQIRNGTWRDLP